ncbi:hypothetical protein N7520_004813 [Penicillium odoratum]|uniref:uncharacterized protein n=1 Tax=Penicillium odoratum TaxID=1167516 RepID=UPI002546C195|nr:uncharacterized protein N7520_004813 [Penicillium odoratum]KAJ5765254.1 hypothetical protein N7520_004813 [Penicillium odoratum]
MSLEPDDACPGQAFHPNEILRKYGIDPKKEQWDASLRIFCNEVYIMYPFLDLRSLWDHYAGLWNGWLSVPCNPTLNVTIEQDRSPLVTQVFVCLAIGQCTASPRNTSEDGRYSAGWSLYRAALEFLGDVFASFEEYEDQLLILQIFALMVIYLFRLDMIGKAEKFLAIAISHAHHLGIHKIENATSGINSCSKEMSRRVWWSLYVLDRRLAIESGRPFLIQDLSTSKPLPQSLPGDLQCYRGSNSLTITPIDFLAATVTYSTVLGKVWEVINGAPSTDATSTFFLKDHFEGHLDERSSGTETTEKPW